MHMSAKSGAKVVKIFGSFNFSGHYFSFFVFLHYLCTAFRQKMRYDTPSNLHFQL